MEIKILQVFYGKDGLPYKDKDRQVHFPITGTGFLGASNTTKIKFYYDELDNLDETTWVAVSKLPNGKLGSRVLESYLDEELNEHYALLELDNYYTQYKGDVFISLQGYQGGVNLDFNEETEQYEIHGTPTIAATGSIKFTNNYAPHFVGSGETDNVNFQRILADLGTKLGIRAKSEFVTTLPTVGENDTFYVIRNDANRPSLANIYIWNGETQHYVWVGDNTLDLGDYYTKEEGEQFEEEIDNRVTSVESELASVAEGSPKGVYATVSDLTTDNPSHDYIYLVLADNKWYYWDGADWTAGGTYMTSSPDSELDPKSNNTVENSVVTQAIQKLCKVYLTLTSGAYIDYVNGNIDTATGYYATQWIKVNPNETYKIVDVTAAYNRTGLAFYDKNKAFISGIQYGSNVSNQLGNLEFTTPSNCEFVRLTTKQDSILYKYVSNQLEEEDKLIYSYDNEGLEVATYLENDGTVDYDPTYNPLQCLTGYIYIKNASRIEITNGSSTANVYHGYYDETFNLISTVKATGNMLITNIPGNAVFMRCTMKRASASDTTINGAINIVFYSNAVIKELSKPYGYGYFNYLPREISCFLNVGVIGDSLASGAAVAGSPGNIQDTPDNFAYSWGQFLARLTGNKYYNFSFGGAKVKTWLESTYATQCYDGEHNCECYIIGLGVNDYGAGTTQGTTADIDLEDYNNNADTFCGNYGKIIQKIQEICPKAKIFCLTSPIGAWSYNNRIKQIVQLFDNCYSIDLFNNGLYKYGPIAYYRRGGHYNAIAYMLIARIIAKEIDKFIENNPDEFNQIEFINTNYEWSNS